MDSFLKDVMLKDDPGRDALMHLLSRRGFFLQGADRPQLAGLIQRLLEECRVRRSYQKECLKALLAELVVEMLCLHDVPDKVQPSKHQEPGYLEEAIRFIYENYSHDIQVSDIASACGLSESHFRRLFTRSLQMKPLDFLNMVRIQEACQLMEKSDEPIREVSMRVGYETASTFNRNFRKATGMSPQDWRREKKGSSGSLRDFQIHVLKGWEGKEPKPEPQAPPAGPGPQEGRM